ncbi:unnamed protein product [Paramecium octaurelia]|uniref:Uncharacterized protein n=1 Tax=Paramecium octaurelia TaxID=43137 RepID=A0A8S1XDE3_PAROT|nr:unnamed protein product [Paramecium octaurelia]
MKIGRWDFLFQENFICRRTIRKQDQNWKWTFLDSQWNRQVSDGMNNKQTSKFQRKRKGLQFKQVIDSILLKYNFQHSFIKVQSLPYKFPSSNTSY